MNRGKGEENVVYMYMKFLQEKNEKVLSLVEKKQMNLADRHCAKWHKPETEMQTPHELDESWTLTHTYENII